MTKIIIPFADTNSMIPYIEFKINDKRYMGLLDTGSESTLFDNSIPESEYFEKKGTDCEMSLVGLNGETSKNRIIDVIASVEIMDVYDKIAIIPINGILLDLSNVSNRINERYGKNLNVAAIFGSDTLKKIGAKIDYRRKQLTIKR